MRDRFEIDIAPYQAQKLSTTLIDRSMTMEGPAQVSIWFVHRRRLDER
jgi:hypothetical protein